MAARIDARHVGQMYLKPDGSLTDKAERFVVWLRQNGSREALAVADAIVKDDRNPLLGLPVAKWVDLFSRR